MPDEDVVAGRCCAVICHAGARGQPRHQWLVRGHDGDRQELIRFRRRRRLERWREQSDVPRFPRHRRRRQLSVGLSGLSRDQPRWWQVRRGRRRPDLRRGYQTVAGLTPGKTYDVKFYQAAGQQNNFGGPTTERFQVSLGAESQLSSLISLAQGATGPWQAQTLTFTATAASEVLTFLAVGTPGGAPPISFLDGVSLTASAPEPASWALMVAGFGIVGAVLRRRAATVAA